MDSLLQVKHNLINIPSIIGPKNRDLKKVGGQCAISMLWHIGGYRKSSTLDVICVNNMFYRRLSFAITALQNRREIPILLVDHVIMVRLTMWGYHRDHEILDSQTSNIVSYHSISMIMKEKYKHFKIFAWYICK